MKAILRAWLFCISIAATALPAGAVSFSDLWWNPDESGWGANLIQQEDVIFATLFVYGTDATATWFVAPATSLSGSSYSGPLYALRGPWFGGPFNPAAVQVGNPVGTLVFTPSGTMRGTLTWSVNGVSVTKSVERQTWRRIALGGIYVGGVDVKNDASCGAPADILSPNVIITEFSETADGSGTGGTLRVIVGDLTGEGFVFNGRYQQYGSMHEAEGSVTVEGVGSVPASLKDILRVGNAIRGELRLQTADGCTMRLRFAGVRDD